MLGSKPIKDYFENGQLRTGYSETRLYRLWSGMKTRCYNPNDKKYMNYGGRGIKMADEWKDNFYSFAEWAVGNGYEEHLTIDRINVDEGYTPNNCRWSTWEEQENNRTNNHLLEYNGEIHTLAEWAKITGIKRHTIEQRIRYGWSVERILTTKTMSSSEAGMIGNRNRWAKHFSTK